MLSSLINPSAKKRIAEEKLFSLIQNALADPENTNPELLLESIQKYICAGADLNKKVNLNNYREPKNKKTYTYHLLMHFSDFAFAQSIFDLGGDPRILNDNHTNLFMKPPNGRGIFTQVCWLDYIHSNFDLKMNSPAYGGVIIAALLIYYFCTMKEIQELHEFSLEKNRTTEGLRIYKKIDYHEKHLTNDEFEEIKKIQYKYLFYSHHFGQIPMTIKFGVESEMKQPRS